MMSKVPQHQSRENSIQKKFDPENFSGQITEKISNFSGHITEKIPNFSGQQ